MESISKINLNSNIYNIRTYHITPNKHELVLMNGTTKFSDYYNKNNENNIILDFGDIVICKFAIYIPDSSIVDSAEFLELAKSEDIIPGTFAKSYKMITTMYSDSFMDGYSSFALYFDGNTLGVNYPHEWGRNAKLIGEILTYKI